MGEEIQGPVSLIEHTLSIDEVAKKYNVDVNAEQPTASKGLAHTEAQERLNAQGLNVLSPPPTQSALVRFLKFFLSMFNILLIVAGLCSFFLYAIEKDNDHLITGPFLIGAAIMNSLIEFYELQKSAQLLNSFKNMVPSKCNVIRSGEIVSIDASELVNGDIVFVKLGDKVPADIYLFHCSDLKVDNSNLTGEAEPQSRSVENTAKNPFEATNLAFNGTLIVSGEGYGIVIRTGDTTLIGQIAGLTQNEKKRPSALLQEINLFVKLITVFAVATATIFFFYLLFRTSNPRSNIGIAVSFAVGILTAWVPQGLPITVTVLLKIAAKRMSKKNVLVKDLPGVETLGALTLLATDKTGTLTRNQMTVALLWTEETLFSTVHDSSMYESAMMFDSSVDGLQSILHISSLCTRARVENSELPSSTQGTGKTKILGDPTDSGLLLLSAQKLRNFHELNTKFPKVLEVPFNSDTKWHLSIHHMPHPTGMYTMLLKGAPERVLKICSNILARNGLTKSLTNEHKEMFTKTYEFMAGKGHRVLAFAKLELPCEEFPEDYAFSKDKGNYPTEGFTFVGLASLEDPPKHGVREAVGNCRLAGIKVVMVTGDHPLTAEAIARTINLMISDTKPRMAQRLGVQESEIDEDKVKAIVIHGEQIDSLTEEDWDMIFSKEEIIFARTSPAHKLDIVKRAQGLGHIVGVTGDGVNDSPALKKADLGIAMNLSGSDVSKESATMVLLDDNFASVVNGIREGRLIFSNLKKGIQYVLTHSIPEVLPQLLYAVAGFPLAITPIQILLIDLFFELITASTFAYEGPESEGLMKLMPRRPVTYESIEQNRAFAEFNARFTIQDEEALKSKKKTTDLPFSAKLRRFFSLDFWRYWAFKSKGGEVLVDWDVLSWSYIYGGLIQFFGAMVTFFVTLYVQDGMGFYEALYCNKITHFKDNAQYTYNNVKKTVREGALQTAQAAFFLSILVIQFFNIFACKCRLTSPFRSYIFKNKKTWYSILAWAIFSSAFIYTPYVNHVFKMSGSFVYYPIFIAVGFGIFLFFCSWLRFWIKSKLNPVNFNPAPLGLQMHPTRWTQKSLNR
ncbi:hypothetical protein HMI54_014865 [Coelomomyces lativittatus]|nr:hypothetical protein HMI56_003737 [Coelomomyces lativittatus]KAJ1513587.1 hypothetical protein HMI54_014865 [Coelomomyces lativittatus]KAJ1514302.1 hypothetical protein HMI55_004776 [Coelomomyces lativittatus]